MSACSCCSRELETSELFKAGILSCADRNVMFGLAGRACKKEDIANVVEKFNCQIDNLTQVRTADSTPLLAERFAYQP